MGEMGNMFRLIMLVLLIGLTANSYAQSGDKLFMDGQQLQQTMTISSQKSAIKKFQAAKVVYTTTDKKKMCDNQISICNKNIASLSRKSNPSKKEKKSPVPEKIEFSLSQNKIEFDGDKAGSVNIKVEAASTDWKFTVTSGVGGMDNFLKVTRSDDAKSIDISTEANDKTLTREQLINVDCGDKRESITVKQKGKAVTLSTNTNQLEFGLKGGNKSVEIYTNSDSIIASNNDLTWYIESMPDWVETNVEVKKKKGVLGNAISAIKKTVVGSSSAASEEGVKISNIKVVVKGLEKSNPTYNSGRKGEIVFASQDKRYRVTVIQQK